MTKKEKLYDIDGIKQRIKMLEMELKDITDDFQPVTF